jgi:hypothetical protein
MLFTTAESAPVANARIAALAVARSMLRSWLFAHEWDALDIDTKRQLFAISSSIIFAWRGGRLLSGKRPSAWRSKAEQNASRRAKSQAKQVPTG